MAADPVVLAGLLVGNGDSVTDAKKITVVYNAPEGYALEIDDVTLVAGVPGEVTVAQLARLKDIPGQSVEEIKDKPAANQSGGNQEGGK